jgi:hypothetical protein
MHVYNIYRDPSSDSDGIFLQTKGDFELQMNYTLLLSRHFPPCHVPVGKPYVRLTDSLSFPSHLNKENNNPTGNLHLFGFDRFVRSGHTFGILVVEAIHLEYWW